VTNQADLPIFEVIVVRDGYAKIDEFIDFAFSYKVNPGIGVTSVDTSFLHASRYSWSRSMGNCGGMVRFVTIPNFGPASTRNVGFNMASGKWVHPIDSDDTLSPGFFTSIKASMKKAGLSLDKNKGYNVIMPELAKANGSPASWQPGGDLDSIYLENRLHCCGLFLRSIYGETRMNAFMSMGWEDWDFWINAHYKNGLNVFYVHSAFYVYSSWTETESEKETVSAFCTKNTDMCTALLHFANNHIYDSELLRDAVSLFLGLKKKDVDLFKIPKRYRDRIKDLAKANHPESMLFTALEYELLGENASALEIYDAVYATHCSNDNEASLTNLSNYLAIRLKDTPSICPYDPITLAISSTQVAKELTDRSTVFAKEAIFGTCAIVYSVIIYSKEDNEKSLRFMIDSIVRQTALPNFEIIVIRDHEDEVFANISSHYQKYPGLRMSRVVSISLVKEKHTPKRLVCAETGNLKIFQTQNIGRASGINLAISIASGLWVHVLNPYGVFSDRLIESIVMTLNSRQLLLSNPGFYNAIALTPSAGLQVYRLPDFEPDYMYSCQMLFLRSMFDEGVRFNPVMDVGYFGYTYIDFWMRLHNKYQLQIFDVLLPELVGEYHPSVSSAKCNFDHLFCRGIFVIIHHEKYEWKIVIEAINQVREYQNLLLPAPSSLEVDHLFSETALIQGLLMEKKGDMEGANLTYATVYLGNCDEKRASTLTKMASYLLERKIVCAKQSTSTEDSSPMNFQKLQLLVNQSKPKNLHHMILTLEPTNAVWIKLMHHAIVGVLKFNPKALVIIHTTLKDANKLFHDGFLKKFRGRLFLAEIAAEELAATGTDLLPILRFMRKNAAGRPFYYSHFTDFYRFLIIYLIGGTYLDMDIVLRGDISHLSNTLCPQSEGFLNGAFMVFEKGHPFIKACLDAIPLVYDPFNWSTIGPHLITSLTNSKELKYLYTPLHRASFYAISWENAIDLISVHYDRASYKALQFIDEPQYGYHFWSRILFRGDHVFKPSSLGGRALIDTCLPRIMQCIVQRGDDTDASEKKKSEKLPAVF